MSESIMRWMRQSDMPEIVKIENQCFPHPWDRDDFDVCLKKKDHIGVVLTIDKTIVGYMIFNFNKSSYNILSIAVDPNHYKWIWTKNDRILEDKDKVFSRRSKR
jgi:ribosomal protein S18 acetylase RimI-like enzyme